MTHSRQPHYVKLGYLQAGLAGLPDSHAIIEAADDDDDADVSGADTFDFDDDGHTVAFFVPETDATFSEMEESGESVSEERLGYVYGDRIPVTGRFTRLVVASGKVHLYKLQI